VKLATANLSVGAHTVTIAYREDGAKMDKLALTTTGAAINGAGTVGANCTSGIPVIKPNQVFPVSETFFNDSTFGTVLAEDPDGPTDFQNWKITGGTGAAYFAIDIATGKLIMKDSASLDFESAVRSFTLVLTTTDGFHKSAPETITINLTNANDNTPVVNSDQSFALDGGTCSELGRVTATDADDTNQPAFTTFQDWQIAGGTGEGIFAINPSTGMITIANLQHVDLYNNSYTLSVTVSDGLHTSAAKTVTIAIPNKITVCHKGALISVSKMAAIGHLQHGDCIGSCGSQSNDRSIVTENANPGLIRVFPNPAVSTITVDLGANAESVKQIQLIEIATGRLVKEVAVNGKAIVNISRSNLAPGMYLVKAIGAKTSVTKITLQ
ncbi:MAG TPA: T9SS type A sorting domain-containing protein, partial [Chitinophagaceae bacterium]